MAHTTTGPLKRIAGLLASSPILARGRRLYDANEKHFNHPLSKLGKLECGLYLILRDYADGVFPPTFDDQSKAYENEINYNTSLPGMSLEDTDRGQMQKPFWNASAFEMYARKYVRLFRLLESLGLGSGARLLELGCGAGWMSEFLAMSGFSVLGTTISHHDVRIAEKRIASLKEKGWDAEMRFLACPMESVAEDIKPEKDFDAVFVFEALHHAYDWRAAIRSSAETLKPGGWMILANEPNLMHTFISYRVAKLSNTHEIGMSRKALIGEMEAAGLTDCRAVRPRINDFFTPHWIIGRR